MRVHIISNLFFPDELGGAALYSDLAEYLKERGHEVRVTTTFSYYPAWKLRKEDQGQSFRDEILNGIPVRRVAMFIPERPTGKARMLSDLTFLIALLKRGKFSGWVPDVVLSAMPMFSQCLAQRFLYLGRRIPKLIVVQDFVVDAALDLGIIRFPGAKFLLSSMQRWALRSAQTLQSISPVMVEKLRASVGDDRRILMVPNWIHGSVQAEIDKQQSQNFKRDPAQLFYSGNVGVKQGLPDFLNQLETALASDNEWKLKICGGGAEAENLKAKVSKSSKCEFGGVLGESDYVRNLLTCTAAVVTQKPGAGANFLPSKLLPALATGTPVLAVCDTASPLGQEVEAGAFGSVIPPGDASRLKTVLMQWRQSPALLKTLSENARKRAELYSRDYVLSIYESELLRLTGIRKTETSELGQLTR